MENYVFSVIIPHHDIPQLLQRCIDTIPDSPEIQVIVIDDNSSEDIVNFESFPGLERKNTTCIFDKCGGGAGHARNLGLRHAVGKWLVFADADDFFTPDAFAILKKYEDAPQDIILFKADSVNSDDYSPSDRHLMLNKAIDDALEGSITAKEAVLAKPVPWCKMLKTEYIKKNNIIFDEVMASNDQMFVAKATCWAGDDAVAVSADVLYTVTTRADSLMGSRWKNPENYLCRLEVQIRYNKFVKDYPHLRQEPIILLLTQSRHFGAKTFIKALALVLRKNALFSGVNQKKIIKHLRLLRKAIA